MYATGRGREVGDLAVGDGFVEVVEEVPCELVFAEFKLSFGVEGGSEAFGRACDFSWGSDWRCRGGIADGVNLFGRLKRFLRRILIVPFIYICAVPEGVDAGSVWWSGYAGPSFGG